MEKLKCNVVMLSAEKASILKKGQTNKLGFSLAMMFIKERNWENQHLYFTSKREIKEGDYCLWMSEVVKTKASLVTVGTKIEATTDPSLGLPLIPQSFVEKYVEVQGNIKEVMIELKHIWNQNGEAKEFGDLAETITSAKTRKDNTVICSSVKDTFTRDEVIAIAVASARLAYTCPSFITDEGIFDEQKVIEWLNTNNLI